MSKIYWRRLTGEEIIFDNPSDCPVLDGDDCRYTFVTKKCSCTKENKFNNECPLQDYIQDEVKE